MAYFEVFKGVDGTYFYWHLVADNGAVIATGGEGFNTKQNAERSLNRVKELMADAEIAEEETE